MKYRVKHVIEYGLLRLWAGLLRRLPYRCSLAFAWFLAGIAFHLVRWRRRETQRRIRAVFGDRYSDREIRHIAWQSIRNIVFTAVDVVRVDRLRPDQLRTYSDTMAVLKNAVESGSGAIIACPHMGSWELAAAIVGHSGMKMFSVAGKQHNPLFDQFLNQLRERGGNEILMRGDHILRAIIKRLKAGQILAVLPDIRMPTPGLPIHFLGQTANIGPGIALFSRLAGVPIVPIINTRDGWTRIHSRAYPPIRPDPALDKEADALRITQAIFDIIESAIRNDPGQWFWYNKRWILDPLVLEQAPANAPQGQVQSPNV
jgi:KDO2-lipid IV(A) lauroyltransferase